MGATYESERVSKLPLPTGQLAVVSQRETTGRPITTVMRIPTFLKMSGLRSVLLLAVAVALVLATGGCASDPNNLGVTNPRHPGPAAGRAAGASVGVAGGNVAGGVVGFGEGVVVGAREPFNSSTRVIRRWRTETTSDGRTIQVPEDIVVDQYGRPVNSSGPSAPKK
jgi:hypothetical protein